MDPGWPRPEPGAVQRLEPDIEATKDGFPDPLLCSLGSQLLRWFHRWPYEASDTIVADYCKTLSLPCDEWWQDSATSTVCAHVMACVRLSVVHYLFGTVWWGLHSDHMNRLIQACPGYWPLPCSRIHSTVYLQHHFSKAVFLSQFRLTLVNPVAGGVLWCPKINCQRSYAKFLRLC